MSQTGHTRVRFAPSPTGVLHIGGFRTALYNYLFARHTGGTFVLRIEDTDRERYVPEAEQYIIDSLVWCGLDYDEGPAKDGGKGPYRQSERKAMYQEYVMQLIREGHAYYAFDTKDELNAMRERLATKENPSPKYDVNSRMSMVNTFTLPAEEVQARIDRGDAYVVRLKVPEGEQVQFEDTVRGVVTFETSQIDDQILLKSDGMPTYHMANVVDDHLMGITHIIRGEEWLSSTPKHILLYTFFGWEPPQMAHLPLILSPNGGKLSKRKADKMGIPINVLEYRDAGYEPEPLVNFLAFLGWNPGTEQEIFDLRGLEEAFTVERVGNAGVQFNTDKLNWYNQQFIKELPVNELARRSRPFLKEAGIEPDEAYLAHVLELMQERLVLAKEIVEAGRFFFEHPVSYDEKAVKKRWKADTGALMGEYQESLEGLEVFTAERIELALKTFLEARETGMGKLMAPLRLSLCGILQGPDLFKTMELLGKDTVVMRIRKAIETLG